MRITVPIEQRLTKTGTAFTATMLGITACGWTVDDAKMELRQRIQAWCSALGKTGHLEEALNRANLHLESNGVDGNIHIEILVKESL